MFSSMLNGLLAQTGHGQSGPGLHPSKFLVGPSIFPERPALSRQHLGNWAFGGPFGRDIMRRIEAKKSFKPFASLNQYERYAQRKKWKEQGKPGEFRAWYDAQETGLPYRPNGYHQVSPGDYASSILPGLLSSLFR